MKKKKVRPNMRPGKSRGKKKNTRKTRKTGTRQNFGKRKESAKKEKKRLALPKVEPWKVVVGAVVLGISGILYLNHVFATQQLLQEVQQLEVEYNRVKRMHDDYRLTYDRMIGPADIYRKAQGLGFINGGPAEKVIEVEK